MWEGCLDQDSLFSALEDIKLSSSLRRLLQASSAPLTHPLFTPYSPRLTLPLGRRLLQASSAPLTHPSFIPSCRRSPRTATFTKIQSLRGGQQPPARWGARAARITGAGGEPTRRSIGCRSAPCMSPAFSSAVILYTRARVFFHSLKNLYS